MSVPNSVKEGYSVTIEQNHIFTHESKFFKLPSISQTLVNTLAANEVSVSAANKKKKKVNKPLGAE
jgi:hypothetical protein